MAIEIYLLKFFRDTYITNFLKNDGYIHYFDAYWAYHLSCIYLRSITKETTLKQMFSLNYLIELTLSFLNIK